jgi:hypothetical protein
VQQSLITVFLLQYWIEEIKVLLASKGNESRIRESYKQMFKKLLDKKGTKSDGIDMGSIRRKFAQVLHSYRDFARTATRAFQTFL